MTEFGSRRRVFMSGQSGQRVGGEQCVPTGRAWTRQEPEQIVVSGMKHDLLVVSDELRAERIFDGTPPSFAALGLAWPERAVILTMPFWLGRSDWAVLVGPFWLGCAGRTTRLENLERSRILENLERSRVSERTAPDPISSKPSQTTIPFWIGCSGGLRCARAVQRFQIVRVKHRDI
jgi:hypothetical protein